MTLRSRIAATMLASCMSIIAVGGAANAAEIVVSGYNPTKFVLASLIPMFEGTTANKVAISYEGPAATLAKVRNGADLDLAIQTPEVIDTLLKEGKIAARTDVFISSVGLAVKAGAPKPDISSADAFKKTLLGAKSVAYSTGQSGVYFASLLQRLGIADQMKPKLIVVSGVSAAGFAAAKGDAEIAIQQVTELMPVEGIDVVGPLPAELQAKLAFSAGIPISAKQPEAAKALIHFFASPAAAPVIKAKGLQPG
jgi:molybdate transport system substrate-binding protein